MENILEKEAEAGLRVILMGLRKPDSLLRVRIIQEVGVKEFFILFGKVRKIQNVRLDALIIGMRELLWILQEAVLFQFCNFVD